MSHWHCVGTICTDPSTQNIEECKQAKESGLVRVVIEAVNSSDFPRVMEAMKRFSKIDALVRVEFNQNGEMVLGCVSEIHLEVTIQDLKQSLLGGTVPIKVSPPRINYRET